MKLGITLGGGGARGAAHIGLLEELERMGARPGVVTGTSIGGLVGALWAAGLPVTRITRFLREIGPHLLTRPSGEPSLTGNIKLAAALEKEIGRPAFDELRLPLAVVSVDLISRREVILDEGDVISAVLATTAFPVVLPPVARGRQMLVDGGLLNNVPFDVARARGATHVIAVDLSNSLPYGAPVEIPSGSGLVARALARTQRSGLWQVLSTVTDIWTTQSVQARLAISRPDLMLRPQVGTIGLFDFHRIDEGLAAGREAVAKALPVLHAVLEDVKD